MGDYDELFGTASMSKNTQSKYFDVLKSFAERWPVALFGGGVRDLFYLGKPPRDLDIVVQGANLRELEEFVPGSGRNAFGGLKGTLGGTTQFAPPSSSSSGEGTVSVTSDGVVVDTWPLERTRGFELDKSLAPTFENLLKTTVFNLEMGIYLVREDLVIADGMEKALHDKVLELNCLRHDNIELSIVRAAILSHRFDLSFGPRLVDFIRRHPRSASVLDTVKQKYYGHIYKDLDIDHLLSRKLPSATSWERLLEDRF